MATELTASDRIFIHMLESGYQLKYIDAAVYLYKQPGVHPDGTLAFILKENGATIMRGCSAKTLVTSAKNRYGHFTVIPIEDGTTRKATDKVIKIVTEESVERAIMHNAYAHESFHDWRMHENLRPMFEELKRKDFMTIFNVMRGIEVCMMLYAGLNISFVTSTHHENVWLIYSTNDIFVPYGGFTGLFMKIEPKEYYEDEQAIISFSHTRSKVMK